MPKCDCFGTELEPDKSFERERDAIMRICSIEYADKVYYIRVEYTPALAVQ